jgi:hypothetical protein
MPADPFLVARAVVASGVAKPESFVYFARDGEDGDAVFIGHGASVAGRIQTLQLSTPRTIVLMAVIVGARPEEREIHIRFKNARVRGNWFRLTPELLAFIESLAAR